MNRVILSILLGGSLAAAAIAPAAAQEVPSGSYQQSCSNVRVRGDQLIARCTNPQGGQVRSSISLDSCRGGDIANSNGQLLCNGGGNGRGYGYREHRRAGYDNADGNAGYGNGNAGYGNGRAASGSYQQSCRNVQMQGGLLTATCPSGNGNMITTSIDASQCRGADIANRNGRLICQ
jgi:hypothetical protein